MSCFAAEIVEGIRFILIPTDNLKLTLARSLAQDLTIMTW